MLNDRSSALSLLRTRRSGRPRDIVAPGPDVTQLREIIAIASRVPDHGKLAPWRFVEITAADRAAFGDLLHRAYRIGNPAPSRLELEGIDRFATQAPALIVAIFSPRAGKIPIWEQQLSCGAACMNLLHGAHALGFAGGWITGWAAYSDAVREAFCHGEECIAGFLFIGTPSLPLEERPRPDPDFILSVWSPPTDGHHPA
ncbi:MAG: nitroreductase [Pseudomonadota bacterium]|nr:nitroreductase [Pseudomonadota bacterium]